MQFKRVWPRSFYKSMEALKRFVSDKGTAVPPPVLINYLDQWLGQDLKGERYLKQMERNMTRNLPVLKPSTPLSNPIQSRCFEIPDIGVNAVGAVYPDDINTSSQTTILPLPKLIYTRDTDTDSNMTDMKPLSSSSSVTQSLPSQPSTSNNSSTPTPSLIPSRIHYGTVRSGQQIYAEGSSLIVIGSVHSGAEVLADGDVHVYGRLDGRAVAGLSGEDARIFATVFDPLLVGVGDAFVVPVDRPEVAGVLGRSVCVSRVNGRSSEGGRGSDDTTGRVVVNCGEGKKLIITPLLL
eukprot:gene8293-17054_t